MTRASAANTKHVRVTMKQGSPDSLTPRPAETLFQCLHCQAEWPLKFPIQISAFANMAKAFQTMHLECKPKDGP